MWWYLTRATGIVATVLLGLSLVWGLTFSSRETGRRLKPNWWLDLHNMLGGLALAFTVAHVVSVIVDPEAGFNIAQAVVPGQATDQATAIAYGIVAAYLLVVVVATSWPRLRFRRRVWRMLHLLSIPAAVLTVLHALQAGSDGQSRGLQALLAVLGGAFVYPATLRLLQIRRRRTSPRLTLPTPTASLPSKGIRTS
jgi:DMSO/TMAO reductase YedYZ heme-binding membrane subunit